MGMEKSGKLKLNAVVMSPTVARRHAERFGTSAPKPRFEKTQNRCVIKEVRGDKSSSTEG